MTAYDPSPYLGELRARAEPGRAAGMAAYHKIDRVYLGVSNPSIDELARDWRRRFDLDTRLAVAASLWDTDIYEARLAAAKLFTQARIRPDDAVWEMIKGWVPDFDSWAIADHVCMAGQKRLVAQPERVADVEPWTGSPHMWTRRAALVITLPWARMNHPKPADEAIRAQVLGWAAGYVPDREWFIQKAIAWWLRDLSKRAPDIVRAFLDPHGEAMKPFARREAAKYLS